MEQRFKNSEDEIASLHVRLAQQFELKKQNGELEISLTACKTELESLKEVGRTRLATLEALRLDKERISSQFAKKQEENKNLQEELDKVFIMVLQRTNYYFCKKIIIDRNIYSTGKKRFGNSKVGLKHA